MDQLLNTPNSNHARSFESIDLLSPSSNTASPGNPRVFAMIPSGYPIIYQHAPQQTFASVLDTYNNAASSGFRPRSNIQNSRRSNNSSRTSHQSFTQPTTDTTASANLQTSAASLQAAVSASDSDFYVPQNSYRQRRSVDGLQCTRPITRSRTMKEGQTAPTTSSNNKRDCSRPSKKRKLEHKPEPELEPKMESDLEHKSNPQCCICLENPLAKDLAKVNGCEHRFCFNCIDTWAERENTCPLCKVRFTQIERCTEAKEKKPSKNSVKKVKFRNQRTDSGRSIQHFLANIETGATIPNMESGSMGAALTHLLIHGLNNAHGSFVTYAPHNFRTRSQAAYSTVLPNRPSGVSNNSTSASGMNRPVFDSLNSRTQWPFTRNPNSDRTNASDLIHLDVDESIFDPESNTNRTSSSAGVIRFPSDTEIDLNDLDTEDLNENYDFVQRVRDLSRERNRVLEQFQHNDPHAVYNVDAGDSPENALEIYDSEPDEIDVVGVVGGQSG